MIKKTQTRIFNITSKNSSINSDFNSLIRCSLPNLNFSNQNIENVYFSVLHCEVPNSFYNCNLYVNQLVLNGVTYTITRGNYNVNTMITQLLSILPAGYSITYSNITNKYTFTHNTTNFTINGDNSACTCRDILGIGNTDITSTGLSLVLPNVVNFLPIQRLNFRSNLFSFGNYNQLDNSSNIFLTLQNDAPNLGIISYKNSDSIKFLIQDSSITAFQISVTDDQNNLINFNGVHWTMTFRIDVEFKENIVLQNFNNIVR